MKPSKVHLAESLVHANEPALLLPVAKEGRDAHLLVGQVGLDGVTAHREALGSERPLDLDEPDGQPCSQPVSQSAVSSPRMMNGRIRWNNVCEVSYRPVQMTACIVWWFV